MFHQAGKGRQERYHGKHRPEHWYRDNTVYLITSKVREGLHLFKSQQTSDIFWDRFNHYTKEARFEPWITTLMSNHYHVVGYIQEASTLGEMMRKFHGSVAWLTCKALDIKHKPFWRDDSNQDYFDGCLRNADQVRRSYEYVKRQAIRAGLVRQVEGYPNTRITHSLQTSLNLSNERKVYLDAVVYPRYDGRVSGELWKLRNRK